MDCRGTEGDAMPCVRVSRVMRVQIDRLSDVRWTELRALAREGAQFANACLADSYARRLGYQAPNGESVFCRAKGSLSGDVRVALAREAFASWKKHGGKIVAGVQRLALFDADRVLVCRAEHLSKGRRQIHARLVREGEAFVLVARLVGKHIGGQHRFMLWPNPKVDDYVRPVLEALVSGETRLLKITFCFERPGRKVFALLTYERWLPPVASGAGVATLGPLEEDGTLWLRWEDAAQRRQARNYTQWVSRIVQMKQNYVGIRDRLRARTRRSGPGYRRAYREALVKAGSFGAWATGELHQLSADIVGVARAAGVGALAVGPLEYHDLPMAQLVTMLAYKAQEAGLVLSRFDPAKPSVDRAIARPLAKRQRGLARQQDAVRVLRDALQRRSA